MTFAEEIKPDSSLVDMIQMKLSKNLHVSHLTANHLENGKHFLVPLLLKAIRQYCSMYRFISPFFDTCKRDRVF